MDPSPSGPGGFAPTRGSEGPLVIELPSAPSPREALEALHGLPGRVLLESAVMRGRFSFLSAVPLQVLRSAGGATRVFDPVGTEGEAGFADPYAALDDLLARWRPASPRKGAAEGIPFVGGIVGYLGYEAGDHLESLPPPPADDVGLPDCWFGVYDGGILWDRPSGRCFAVASRFPERPYREAERRLEALVLRVLEGRHTAPLEPADAVPGVPTSSLMRRQFMEGVERIQGYIRAGDLFQANLTRRITVPTGLSGTAIYRRLVEESPADHAAYLDTGEGEVLSISPELFLRLRDREVLTAPIKGTRPRGGSPEEDAELREALRSSAKDRAENVMIVDLLRNDLSRVSLPGSVTVPRLAEVDTHPTVHHLVSEVSGVLRPEVGVVDLLRATFPGGSITGAPKIRAMEILRELEPVRRGVYTGALGILGFGGDAELSVAIRTAVLRDGLAHYGTGGGITLGSDPEAEWKETEDKAAAFLRALRREGPDPDPRGARE